MSTVVVLSILFTLAGAFLGAVASQDVDAETPKLRAHAAAARGAIVGAVWGGIGGAYLGHFVTWDSVRTASAIIFWPFAALVLFATVGIAARAVTRAAAAESRHGALARMLSAISETLAIAAILGLFVCVVFVIPNAGSSGAMPTAVSSPPGTIELHVTSVFAIVGGFVGAFALLFVAAEFSFGVLGAVAGQFAGAIVGAAFFDATTDARSALDAAIAACAGGLCISIASGLIGAGIAAAMSCVLTTVWILMPGLGNHAKPAAGPDGASNDLVVKTEGDKLLGAATGFARLAGEEGPLRVAAVMIAMFAFVGVLLGFAMGPLFGENVVKTFGG